MNTKVHAAIVRAIRLLMGNDALRKLNKNINKEAWQKVKDELGVERDWPQETYFDLIVLGAYFEDDVDTTSDVPDPVIDNSFLKKILEKATGPNQHWLEHFWNTKREKGKGVKIDIDYICEVITEILCGEWIPEFIHEIKAEVIEFFLGNVITLVTNDGSFVLGEFR